jgi:hypothetical protein
MIWTIMAHNHAKPKRNLEGVHQMYFELDEVCFLPFLVILKRKVRAVISVTQTFNLR